MKVNDYFIVVTLKGVYRVTANTQPKTPIDYEKNKKKLGLERNAEYNQLLEKVTLDISPRVSPCSAILVVVPRVSLCLTILVVVLSTVNFLPTYVLTYLSRLFLLVLQFPLLFSNIKSLLTYSFNESFY